MLVLSRKVGEQIVIDDNIVVTVLQLKGKRIQIGIQAPSHVNIRREELSVHADRAKTPELVGAGEPANDSR
jgi:carbon storage regulator